MVARLTLLFFLAMPLTGRAEVRFEQRIKSQLPLNVQVTDESGARHPLDFYFHQKPVLVTFAYYGCPNLCTLVLNGVVNALKKVSSDAEVLTLSIDPREKSSLALAKQRTYLARLGASHLSWHFLTADRDAIQKLTQAAGFHYELDPLSHQYAHPSGLLVATPRGVISQYFLGIQFQSDLLEAAIRRAARSRVGTIVDDVLLFCFHYEPSSSKAGLAILRTIRGAGLVGAGLLAGFLVYLFRRESTL